MFDDSKYYELNSCMTATKKGQFPTEKLAFYTHLLQNVMRLTIYLLLYYPLPRRSSYLIL